MMGGGRGEMGRGRNSCGFLGCVQLGEYESGWATLLGVGGGG